jgi:hypothetical protein
VQRLPYKRQMELCNLVEGKVEKGTIHPSSQPTKTSWNRDQRANRGEEFFFLGSSSPYPAVIHMAAIYQISKKGSSAAACLPHTEGTYSVVRLSH